MTYTEEYDAAFGDQALLDHGFSQTNSTFRKQVDVPTEVPVDLRSAHLEPMSVDMGPVRLPSEVRALTVPPRAELLREAEQLITGERNVAYGSPTQNFQNIAALFNIQFGHMLKEGASFTGAHIAQAMIHVKQARLIAAPKRDNYLDIAGYAACGWEAQADQS